jgi:hypothetical protein
MSENLLFSAFDPIRVDAPNRCDVCASKAPVFRYECDIDAIVGHSVSGFCCRACAGKMLDRLQRFESQTWAEEEASLQTEDIDISDLKQRRLATFGK